MKYQVEIYYANGDVCFFRYAQLRAARHMLHRFVRRGYNATITKLAA
jgi:hypothetical protein